MSGEYSECTTAFRAKVSTGHTHQSEKGRKMAQWVIVPTVIPETGTRAEVRKARIHIQGQSQVPKVSQGNGPVSVRGAGLNL